MFSFYIGYRLTLPPFFHIFLFASVEQLLAIHKIVDSKGFFKFD